MDYELPGIHVKAMSKIEETELGVFYLYILATLRSVSVYSQLLLLIGWLMVVMVTVNME